MGIPGLILKGLGASRQGGSIGRLQAATGHSGQTGRLVRIGLGVEVPRQDPVDL